MSDAFSLDGAVEPFDVGVVVGSAEAAVSGRYVRFLQGLLKVTAIFWFIVALHHRDGKTPPFPGFKHRLGG